MITPPGGCLHGHLTGAAWPQLQSLSSVGREVSKRLVSTSSGLLTLRQGSDPAHPVSRKDGRLQDGVSPAFLTLAPTLSNLF